MNSGFREGVLNEARRLPRKSWNSYDRCVKMIKGYERQSGEYIESQDYERLMREVSGILNLGWHNLF